MTATNDTTERASVQPRDLRDRIDDPTHDHRRCPAARRLQRLAARTARRAAATSRAPSRFPAAWLDRVDEAEIRRAARRQGHHAGPRRSSSTATTPTQAARVRRPARRARPRRRRGATRAASRPGPPTTPCRSSACRATTSLVHIAWLRDVLAGERPEAYAERQVPAVPRQLRGARGVRRGPHPGRPLPRHELARGPGRLEPPLARGDRRGARGARASPTTRRSSSTAATRRATPTRSGRAAAPARSRPTRAPLILRYAGVDDVRLLDGGYDWWVPDGNPLETVIREPTPVADFGVSDPAPAGGHRRHRRGQGDPRRPRRRGPRQRPDVARAHRQRQRLQLHRPGRPDRGRRLGQLRHRRVPHAALPQRRQHDAGLPGDRGQLGRGRDHAATSGSPSTAAPAGAPARPGSTPTCRTGSGSRSTTAAGSSGARTRSTTRSRSASPRTPSPPEPRATTPTAGPHPGMDAGRAVGGGPGPARWDDQSPLARW